MGLLLQFAEVPLPSRKRRITHQLGILSGNRNDRLENYAAARQVQVPCNRIVLHETPHVHSNNSV